MFKTFSNYMNIPDVSGRLKLILIQDKMVFYNIVESSLRTHCTSVDVH